VQAQAVLAFCYEFELGVELDFVLAQSLYSGAAVKNNGLGNLLHLLLLSIHLL
jgi:TPR repeat protein